LKYGFAAACEKLLLRTGHALEHHPKQVTAAIAALLLGAGGAAFGVATLDPQPDNVVVRQVLEEVAPLPLDEQLHALENNSISLYRTDRTRLAETVDGLLARMGVDDPAAASFLRREPTFRAQFLAHAGRPVSVESNERHQLVKFTGRWMPDSLVSFKRLVVERAGDAFVSHVETAALTPSVHLGSALVRTSLFAAADEVNVPDAVVSQMVEIFGSEIDFHRDLRLGDRFSVVYETLDADGEPMRTGRILSAEFVNAGTAYNTVWFQPPGGKGGYYSLDGKSLETSYLPSPLKYSRVTSGFAMRFHPILHQWKAHLGVDYAAATGTPVRTVGDGTVEFAGVQNGFGNVVIVRHNAIEETVYAHLSRIAVHRGEDVEQGQTIGNVGQTGWATGPHLHFEFRVNGVHQNPTVMMARHNQDNTISAQLRPQFERVANSARIQLAAATRETTVASAR
jgi:murein DD-endopeptidase MepM/ murein hydrolase activator NlpD